MVPYDAFFAAIASPEMLKDMSLPDCGAPRPQVGSKMTILGPGKALMDGFQAAFGMTKDDFAGLPKWKKQQKKKEVGLF